jgi:AcrR family transcriptional regulator
MRRLAQALGVEAMTLYYHVSNKREIVNAIADLIVGEIDLPGDDAGWKAALRATAISAHQTFLRHPWAASLTLSTEARESRLRYMESILGTLRRAGFSADMTDHGYHALESHIVGFTLWEVGITTTVAPLDEMAGAFLRSLPVGVYPHLTEHVEQHVRKQGADGEDGEFEFGLDLILDGLERLRDGSAMR